MDEKQLTAACAAVYAACLHAAAVRHTLAPTANVTEIADMWFETAMARGWEAAGRLIAGGDANRPSR